MTTPDRTAEIRARLESRKVGLVLDHHITLDISDVEYLIAALAASEAREKELRDQLDRMNLAGKAPSP